MRGLEKCYFKIIDDFSPIYLKKKENYSTSIQMNRDASEVRSLGLYTFSRFNESIFILTCDLDISTVLINNYLDFQLPFARMF